MNFMDIDYGPTDPPDRDLRPCPTCNGSGGLCAWCHLPTRDGDDADRLEAPKDLCSCSDDDVTEEEWIGRLIECGDCIGFGGEFACGA